MIHLIFICISYINWKAFREWKRAPRLTKFLHLVEQILAHYSFRTSDRLKYYASVGPTYVR